MTTPTLMPGTNTTVNIPFLQAVRRMGLIEGTSTLILFGVAMPLKYVANMPMAVRIVGSLHGFLFVALVLLLMLAVRRIPISRGFAMLGVLAAIVPLGPFLYDRWLLQLLPPEPTDEEGPSVEGHSTEGLSTESQRSDSENTDHGTDADHSTPST